MADDPIKTTDPLDTPLPCDVRCGSVKFSKGVSLRTFVEAATRWKVLADAQVAGQMGDLARVRREFEMFDPRKRHTMGDEADG